MRNTKLVAIGLACVLLSAGAAQGQWDMSRELTAQDRQILRMTVRQQIHGKPVGAVASWANPTSRHSGSIRLLSKSVRQGMPCERIEYRIVSRPGERPEQYVFTSCRLPDGTWKLAD